MILKNKILMKEIIRCIKMLVKLTTLKIGSLSLSFRSFLILPKSLSLLIFLLVFIFGFSVQEIYSQSNDFICGTDEYLLQQKRVNPNLESFIKMQESKIQKWIKDNPALQSDEVITIPVVVHIIYNTDEQNIPDLRVHEQIALSNRDFAGLNLHSMGAFPDSLKANTGLQFCLARKTPDGQLTNGIERRYTTVPSFSLSDSNSVKYYNKGGLDAWDPAKYLNIWVCNLIITNGYAQFPYTGVNETYGAVINYSVFGTTGASSAGNRGGTTTHELGHCFNLVHTWCIPGCDNSDYCDDTPNQDNFTLGYHTGLLTDSCSPSSPGIMYMNFMDYSSDSIYANFTPKQTENMRSMFSSPYGPLVSLSLSDVCSPPSSNSSPAALTKTEFIISPNPAGEQLNICYTIAESSIVTFIITNSLGIELARIDNNQIHSSGNYNINYETGNLKSGVYYLSMQSSNLLETKKFMVIK